MMEAEYDKASAWGSELQARFMEHASDTIRYHMSGVDLTTAGGVKHAAEAGISALQSGYSCLCRVLDPPGRRQVNTTHMISNSVTGVFHKTRLELTAPSTSFVILSFHHGTS